MEKRVFKRLDLISVSNEKKWNMQEISLITVFMVSLTMTMLFCIIYKKEWLLQSDILSQPSLSLIKAKDYDKSSLFLYILRERMWLIPLLFLLSTTYLARTAVYVSVVWFGIAFGSLISVLMLRYGMRGIFFLLLCSFPQYLFFLPAWVIAFRLSMVRRIADKKFFLQMIVLESVIFLGCLAECFVNSNILEKVIKIFIGV